MNCHEAAKTLLEHNNILIITHKNPDGDTLGSAAALCSALLRAGRRAALYPNVQITEKFVPYVNKYIAGSSFKAAYILAIDVAAEDMFCKGFSGDVDFCIDHHPSNPHYASADIVVPESSSCGEIILDIIEEMHGDLTSEEATLLYIALSTDTGCFRHGNTNANSFYSAGRLCDYGADVANINTAFFKKSSSGRIKLESMVFSNMDLFDNGRIAVAKVTLQMMRDSGATENDCDNLADLPTRVDTEIVAVTIREQEEGRCKVSVRTDETIDANRICSYFGGGGHKMASGCTINASPDKAEKMLVDVIKEVMK